VNRALPELFAASMRPVQIDSLPLETRGFPQNEAVLETQLHSHVGICIDPQVIFVSGIHQAALGGKELKGLVLRADELILDPLKVAPFVAH